ncbi:DUF7285 family protein [Halobacterium litoreum]|uniref:Uncharacterized protein n=1 Tax=Halobacterium litoreum TaxID=2039234 RepID=A0ABD5NHA8_9EURY|nr:hypothetical protein [Halobacterium litoreum]UHH12771.1 hypothetical protein LT972_11445 [Halobacterium litoreum]
MSRSSARRAQVEPVPALAAVLAVCLALGAYASARGTALPGIGHGAPTDAVLADASDAVTEPGSAVASPADLTTEGVAPEGFRVAVTLTAGDREWTAGPEPPDSAASESGRVPVRVAPGRVRPGHLTVAVWQ